MQYGYAYQLGERAGGLDPSAKAYINAIVAAGATVTSTQKNAINTFYKTGKAEGWYGQLKRMFLPIWGIAAPNAIGMISGSSGTFNGTVTHANGYVQGDGSTGYFDFGSRMPADGLTFDNGMIFCLARTGPGSGLAHIGVVSGNNSQSIRSPLSTNLQGRYTNNATVITSSVAPTGILIIQSQASNSRSLFRRSTSGTSFLSSSTETASFSLANFNCYAMARNNAGLLNDPGTAQLGAYGYGLKMESQLNDFSLAVKNLWESCTGLTLP